MSSIVWAIIRSLPHKVIWMEQQEPGSFRAAVVSEEENSPIPNKLIIPDHKLYFTELTTETEAHYLCGFP